MTVLLLRAWLLLGALHCFQGEKSAELFPHPICRLHQWDQLCFVKQSQRPSGDRFSCQFYNGESADIKVIALTECRAIIFVRHAAGWSLDRENETSSLWKPFHWRTRTWSCSWHFRHVWEVHDLFCTKKKNKIFPLRPPISLPIKKTYLPLVLIKDKF